MLGDTSPKNRPGLKSAVARAVLSLETKKSGSRARRFLYRCRKSFCPGAGVIVSRVVVLQVMNCNEAGGWL